MTALKSFKLLLLLVMLPLLTSSTSKHEYYVSVTEITYVKAQQSLQIISQIFIDDFETLLRERYDESITLDPDTDAELIESYMKRYLADRLKLQVNGNNVTFKFIGKAYKDDITYCYLEVGNITELKSIELTNSLLFDVISEQQNIVRLKAFNKNKSFLLLPENDKCVLNFN